MIETESGHMYETEDGTLVPSVTTILKILGAQELLKWANWLGYKHVSYADELARTSYKGTKIHQNVQRVVDPPKPWDEDIEYNNPQEKIFYETIAAKFRGFISQFHYETIFTEKEFVSKNLGYGGTIDWYAKIAGYNMLVDFKSSKQVRLKHLLQLGGYYPLMKEAGYPVEAASIIIVNERGCSLYPIREEVLIELSQYFQHVAYLYESLQDNRYLPESDKELLEELKKGI